MKFKNIHQFSAGFNDGDAISNYMILLRRFFKKLGIGGEIFSQNIGATGGVCKKYTNYSYKSGDCIIYHHSIHSKIIDFLINLNFEIPKILIYHNVTPYQYILPYDYSLAYYLKTGREELDNFIDLFHFNFAVSNYNKSELDNIGYRNVKSIPILMPFDKYIKKEKKEKKTFQIVFVGRIAPNKKQCDLIRIAKVLNDYFHFDFKLVLVGNTSKEMLLYRDELEQMIQYFSLHSRIEILDFLDQDQLNEVYSNADLFLCMSEHEGFCVPLVEAMQFEIPIVAYSAGAIPETLAGSGVLVYEKKFDLISELIYRISQDQLLSQRIVEGQNQVLQKYKQNIGFDLLVDYLGLKDY
jgi:L-malate glycosyltransferase